jgi:multisubunit Na+/H+ antiporter MnhB subunit
MNGIEALFDLLLLALLVALAWLLLATRDLFKAIVLFIAFGLLLSLVWVRLNAPDIALAEAAIGAGITGALLLVGLGRLGSAERCRPPQTPITALQRFSSPLIISLLIPSIVAILLLELFTLPPKSAGQVKLIAARLSASGVDHPVTAVLLNFRGYDTFLEMGVLLLAVLAIWSLDQACHPFEFQQIPEVLLTLQRLLLPPLILTSGFILQQGAQGPGGAFQAGALLAAGIILAALCGQTLAPGLRGWLLRFTLACGFLTFLLVVAATLALTGKPLVYPDGFADSLILLIEITATVSIATLLAAAVAGGHPAQEDNSSTDGDRESV